MRWVACLALLVGCFGDPGDDVRIQPDTGEERVFEGEVSVSPESLALVGVPGERVVGTVVVANVGEYDLTLESAAMTEDADGVLVTDEQTNGDRVISPERSFEVLVRCELPADHTDDTDAGALVEGVLRVRTSDEDTPTVDVAVSCAVEA